MTRLNELMEAWRAATPETRSTHLLGEIAEAAERVARDGAKRYRLPDADVDDVAQEVSARFVSDLRPGGSIPERPEAFVWRMAENRATDLWRAVARGRGAVERLTGEASSLPPSEDPERLWIGLEDQDWARRTVRELLEQAPENYKVTLRRHYLDEVPIDDLAEETYRRLLSEQGELSEVDAFLLRKKARNLVDQHLKRGKDWLRKRIAERMAEDDR